jgi:hypothetical protein
MKTISPCCALFFLLMTAAPIAAAEIAPPASRYAKSDEAFYVLACVEMNGQNAEGLQKCSCAIDTLSIARNSSFTHRGRPVDVKQVGRELGVRYVLEGGVRKAANRVRITAQLIDALNGAHLWADRFDGALDHIFDLQDQVTASVVGISVRMSASSSSAHAAIEHGRSDAIGIVSARIAEIVIRDERAAIPIGSFNRKFGVTLSLPSVIGRHRVIEIMDPSMSDEERQMRRTSAKAFWRMRNA